MRFHKNNSSALLKIFLSVSLFFSSTYSFASVENEAWIYFTKHFPEQYNQSPNLMSLLQEVNLNLLLEDKTYFKQVDELNLKRSKVTFQGNRIVLIDDKAVVWIELKNAAKREFLINGRTLFYDVNKPIIQQLAVTFKEKNQTSKSERWLNLMLNQVWAVEPATVVGLALENSGSEALGTTLLARGALAGGAAVAGSAVAARAAAIIAAAAAVAGGLYCGGRAVSAEKNQGWNEFLNCASTPLSWMGVNPRDTLQVKELNCKVASTGDLAGVEIRVESSRGEIQKRTFSLEKGTGLRKVEIQSTPAKSWDSKNLVANFDPITGHIQNAQIKEFKMKNSETKSQELTPSKNSKELKDVALLTADFNYYRSLCLDSKRLKEFENALRENKGKAPVSLRSLPKVEAGSGVR